MNESKEGVGYKLDIILRALYISCSFIVFFNTNLFGQTNSITANFIECDGDSVKIQSKTNLIFTGWKNANGSVEGISSPESKETWVHPINKTTYIASAKQLDIENLIVNGNFEQGMRGFTSGYALNTKVVTNGMYNIGSNPGTQLAAYVMRGDHTSGKGNMLIADGSTDTTRVIYSTEVDVEDGKEYVFSAWLANMHKEFASKNPDTVSWKSSQFVFDIDGEPIGNLTLPADTIWREFIHSYVPQFTKTITISIRSNITVTSGNDFVIDDLSFYPYVEYFAFLPDIYACNKEVVFSPNGDGILDTYYVEDSGVAKIFDLSGTLVQQINVPGYWNGSRMDGKEATAGFYAIVVDENKIFRVSLIR